LVGWLIN